MMIKVSYGEGDTVEANWSIHLLSSKLSSFFIEKPAISSALVLVVFFSPSSLFSVLCSLSSQLTLLLNYCSHSFIVPPKDSWWRLTPYGDKANLYSQVSTGRTIDALMLVKMGQWPSPC